MPALITRTRQPVHQVLSLDVALGAVAVGIFTAKLLEVGIQPKWLLILAGAVWVVYTLDHLLDGYKLKGASQIYRHRFHYDHRKILIIVTTLIATVTVISAFIFLNKRIIMWGIYLALFVLAYFLINYISAGKGAAYIQKELIIAAVYISGILLAPMTWYGEVPKAEVLFIVSVLFLLAWSEGLIISWFDYSDDKADGLSSFTTVYGPGTTRTFLIALLAGTILALLAMISALPGSLYLIAMVIEISMSLVLLLLIVKPEPFRKKRAFRWIGESVFLLPAFILFV